MKLVMTLLARDEDDIIEANLHHHFAQGVDHVIATDNGSTDRTRQILVRHRDQGRLDLIDEPTHDMSQHRWVTRMARLAATAHGADWVINNDADEFWWPTAAPTVRDALVALGDDVGTVVAPRFNLLARPDDGRPWTERMTVRMATSAHHPGLLVEGTIGPKLCHRADPDVVVRQGNHELDDEPRLGRRTEGPLEIVHAPFRSWDQFRGAAIRAGTAYARNREMPPEIGHVRRSLYEAHLDGSLARVWNGVVHDDTQIAAGLDDGRFTVDERLVDLPVPRPPASLPAASRLRRARQRLRRRRR